jgi:glycerol-3-phosphate dehydrogenase
VVRIAVIGAGAWGTALSTALPRGGAQQIALWVYQKEVAESHPRH